MSLPAWPCPADILTRHLAVRLLEGKNIDQSNVCTFVGKKMDYVNNEINSVRLTSEFLLSCHRTRFPEEHTPSSSTVIDIPETTDDLDQYKSPAGCRMLLYEAQRINEHIKCMWDLTEEHSTEEAEKLVASIRIPRTWITNPDPKNPREQSIVHDAVEIIKTIYNPSISAYEESEVFFALSHEELEKENLIIQAPLSTFGINNKQDIRRCLRDIKGEKGELPKQLNSYFSDVRQAVLRKCGDDAMCYPTVAYRRTLQNILRSAVWQVDVQRRKVKVLLTNQEEEPGNSRFHYYTKHSAVIMRKIDDLSLWTRFNILDLEAAYLFIKAFSTDYTAPPLWKRCHPNYIIKKALSSLPTKIEINVYK